MPSPWAAGAQVRIVGELHGQDTINVLHFATNTAEIDVSPPSPLLVALVAAVIDCIITALLPALTQDWTLKYVDARYVFNGGGSPLGSDPVIQTPDPDTNGTSGVTSVSFASSLVNIRSGLGGKSGRGKMFLPPPGEASITNGVMTSDASTAITAFLTCMAGKFLGTSPSTAWRWGVFSRKLGGTNFASWNAGFFIASQLSPVPTIAVLARRKIGHGR